MPVSFRIFIAPLVVLFAQPALFSQNPAPAPAAARRAPAPPTPEERARLRKLAEEDHQAMLTKLGITALRPGRAGSWAPKDPNQANYDEAKANPYPDYPEILKLKHGAPVTDAAGWWTRRRPEIAEDFEREVYGRIPANVPAVHWTVDEERDLELGGRAAHALRLSGHVDNSAYPAIDVTVSASLVLPRGAKGPVPVLILFGSGGFPGEDLPWPAWAGPEPQDPPSAEQLIAAGWGYVSLSPTSIQADNGAGLSRGIIGLTAKGARREPEDWGALRAWGWGASRLLDFLETLPAVDAKRVGIEGVSRFGKAALVTMAFDRRFAVALIGSSGEGGTKPHRRDFGEAVENLAGPGQYHWMAGNFLKYAAEEPAALRRTPNDLPVDAHELIALCAPRPVFISYGIPERGDDRWLDQQGSYMAAVAAGQVYRLLGARDLGDPADYRQAKMPAPTTGLLEGDLAWRQHTGGHEDRSNMKHFIAWANRRLGVESGSR